MHRKRPQTAAEQARNKLKRRGEGGKGRTDWPAVQTPEDISNFQIQNSEGEGQTEWPPIQTPKDISNIQISKLRGRGADGMAAHPNA